MELGRNGDIVLFRFKLRHWWQRPLSALIAWLQDNPITHTAIIIDSEQGVIVEAYWPKVRRRQFAPNTKDRFYDWDIVRPVKTSEKQRSGAATIARSWVGVRYDTRSLLSLAYWLFIEKLLGGIFIRSQVYINDDPRKLFCQELVTQAYEEAGVPFTALLGMKDPSAVLPKDLDLQSKAFLVIESSYNWPQGESI